MIADAILNSSLMKNLYQSVFLYSQLTQRSINFYKKEKAYKKIYNI